MTITIKNLSFRYQQSSDPALTAVNLNIPRGTVMVLCGPSGCGKTSLSRLINGLIPEFFAGDFSGEIFINDKNLSDYAVNAISRFVGSVFQNPKNQFFNLNTSDELTFTCQNLSMPAVEIKRRAAAVVCAFNLSPLLNRSVFAISGGEAQKIACAAVACVDPDIMVLDEPSANLDFAAVRQLRDIILSWKKNGKTIVLAEHRLHYLLPLADYLVYMDGGQIKKIYTAAGLQNLSLAEYNQLGLRARNLQEIFSPLSKPQQPPLLPSQSPALTVEELTVEKPARIFTFAHGELYRGHVYALIGNNGVGKSTFLKALAGLLPGTGGKIKWQNKILSPRQLTPYAYLVMQDVNQQLFMPTVFAEVFLSLRGQKLTAAAKTQITAKILAALNLTAKTQEHPFNLSGGEKQRLAIAAAIAGGRPLILFDEPTSGLDYRNMVKLADLIKELAVSRLVLFITHDPEFILHCATDIIYFKEQGILLKYSLQTAVGQKVIRDFFAAALPPVNTDK